jgi:2-polyprenyl-3-methyl-5-hydroxy-6-metoxy-1,4-benzoquinol methylase
MGFYMNENLVENYGWSGHEGPESCNYITPGVVKILDGLKIRRIADLGAGNGALCAQLASAGYDVVGIEYDKNGVAIAQASNLNIPFYNYGVQDDPAKLLATEEKFDAVVSTEVIEHLFAPHLLPRYACGILKENGYLVITTPYHGYVKNLALSVFNKWDDHHTALWCGGHIKFWSPATLGRLLGENGFRVVGFSGVGRLAYLWKSMILVARKI